MRLLTGEFPHHGTQELRLLSSTLDFVIYIFCFFFFFPSPVWVSELELDRFCGLWRFSWVSRCEVKSSVTKIGMWIPKSGYSDLINGLVLKWILKILSFLCINAHMGPRVVKWYRLCIGDGYKYLNIVFQVETLEIKSKIIYLIT